MVFCCTAMPIEASPIGTKNVRSEFTKNLNRSGITFNLVLLVSSESTMCFCLYLPLTTSQCSSEVFPASLMSYIGQDFQIPSAVNKGEI